MRDTSPGGGPLRSCALCHSVHSKRFLAATSWNNAYGIELRKCLACGFVFSAQAEFSYEEFFVDAFVGKDKDELLRVARAQGLHTVVAKIAAKTGLRRGARVMDFGAGIGLAALSFMEFGFDVCAVEESRRYLERHRALGVASFPSLGEAASAGKTFDLVVMKDVLEHLTDPSKLLGEVIGCIGKGGYLYVRVPNVLAYKFHWAVDTKSHVSHFAPRTLIRLMKGHGMKLKDFVSIHDISSRAGRMYNAVFWRIRSVVPLYHQISMLFIKE
jgi:2-polyprenyl-3-methyl-5-hydroxy-6-metoxy-1,4-benzoquinol methylase